MRKTLCIDKQPPPIMGSSWIDRQLQNSKLCRTCQTTVSMSEVLKYQFVNQMIYIYNQGSCSHGKPGKTMEFKWLIWIISILAEVIEIFKNVKSHGKWKFTITKMTFWPNIKCNIRGNTLNAHATGLLLAQGWVLKGHGISLFYRKDSEGAWTLIYMNIRHHSSIVKIDRLYDTKKLLFMPGYIIEFNNHNNSPK